MSGYFVRGIDAQGNEAEYPPDDVLRATDERGWRMITDQHEAMETARCALIEGEGWRVAYVFAHGDVDVQVGAITRV